ncbi:UDP-N-acetylmuramate dehydrogenase [Candidatus Wolfebacteria bacterium]|nr:UDP-N-acetylmuramate dehydrogenase [Candidatus Wolfebacteria bacterium]
MIKIKKEFSLKKLTTFEIGGKSEYFTEAKNEKELLEALDFAKKNKLKVSIIAGGSNVVFSDKLLKGLLIKISGTNLRVYKNEILVDAGVSLSRVIDLSIKNNLKGLESLSGIPGTIGGAIIGNAGAYGQSVSEVVEEIEILDGERKKYLKNKQCHFSYRNSIFKNKNYIILRILLKFQKGDSKKLKKISKEIIKIRNKKYSNNLKCPGSFFKNLQVKDISKSVLKKINKNKIIKGKIPAGYLLEEVGARGMREGDIKIADYHGNLLINSGKAKFKDVKKIVNKLKNKVKNKFNIILEEEVRYL